jgi:hypothetical protein
LNARLAVGSPIQEIQEAPRLYSKQRIGLQDEVAPEHAEVHAVLQRWGMWNAERYKAMTSGSVESRYREQTARSTGQSVDPVLVEVERAVLRMPLKYRDSIRAFYVTRSDASYISRMISLPVPKLAQEHGIRSSAEHRLQSMRHDGAKSSRQRAFTAWMYTARCMVVNLLRQQGIVLSSAAQSPPTVPAVARDHLL